MIGIAGFGAFSCLLSSLAQNIVGLYIYPNKLKEVFLLSYRDVSRLAR